MVIADGIGRPEGCRPITVLARSALFAVAMTALAATSVLAQQAATIVPPTGLSGSSYEHLAFDVADTDGDGRIDEAELTRDAAAAFSGLDIDRNEVLTPEELGPHDPRKFQRVDRNGDGKLTFSEVMTFKTQGFKQADANKDGYLSFDEMYKAAEAEVRG